jgi:transcriptional regulator with XRE-family HTH domain
MGRSRKHGGFPSDVVLGRNLEMLRIKHDMTRKELARKVPKLTAQQIDRIESGGEIVPMRLLENIFQVYGSHVDRKLWRKIGNQRQEDNPDDELLLLLYEQLFEDELDDE